jgi:ribosomal protein S18 acetylase RimI-like enzyme
MVRVRRATVADTPAMGRLHVRAWQAAYRGQMPDGYLDGLRADERAASWERALGRERPRSAVLVAERDGEVVGFAALGPSPDPEGAGELFSINVDPDHWGTGTERTVDALGVTIPEVRYRRRSSSPDSSSATPDGTE